MIMQKVYEQLHREFSVQYDEIVKNINDWIRDVKIIITKLLPNKTFMQLNDLCARLRDDPSADEELLDKARQKLLEFYRLAGIDTKHFPVFFFRGPERTEKYWIAELNRAYAQLKSLGKKESFINKNIQKLVGNISDEKQLVRAYYEKNASVALKDIKEYILEDSKRIRKQGGPVVAISTPETIIKEAPSKKLEAYQSHKIEVYNINLPPEYSTDGIIKSTPESTEATKLIAKLVGPVGQMLCSSKTWGREKYGPRMVFNANIFMASGEKVWYGDILLGPITIRILKQISRLIASPLYVLYEGDGRFLDFVPTQEYLEERAILKVYPNKAMYVYRGCTGDIEIPY